MICSDFIGVHRNTDLHSNCWSYHARNQASAPPMSLILLRFVGCLSTPNWFCCILIDLVDDRSLGAFSVASRFGDPNYWNLSMEFGKNLEKKILKDATSSVSSSVILLCLKYQITELKKNQQTTRLTTRFRLSISVIEKNCTKLGSFSFSNFSYRALFNSM